MVLQTFIQNMLPKDGAAVYGKGVAGDMWKSLMAEKLADVMAERGGIGIADRMLGDHYVEGKKALSVGAVSSGPEKRRDRPPGDAVHGAGPGNAAQARKVARRRPGGAPTRNPKSSADKDVDVAIRSLQP